MHVRTSVEFCAFPRPVQYLTVVLVAALGLGVLKRGISNSLGVMVAKGWGIVRERYVDM